jgi:heptosyltransferase IV
LGDMVLMTTVFKAINEKYPEAKIDVLTGRNNFSIIENNKRINKLLIYDKSPLKLLRTFFQLKKKKYDYLIDPKDHYSTESKLIAKIVKAKTKIGFNRPDNKIFDIGIPSAKENQKKHFIERAFNSLNTLDIKISDSIPIPELFLNQDSDNYVKGFLKVINNPKYIVINISAGNKNRVWETQKWISFINSIKNENYKLILLFAFEEKEMAIEILNHCTDLINFNSRNINDGIALIYYSQLVITPDTVFIHIASAFDKPVLGLYNGLTDNYFKFKPLSSITSVVRLKEENDNLSSITVEEVIKGYNEIIGRI